MNTTKELLGIALAAGLLAATGCATGPEAVENDFGNSVRQMTEAQTVNPSAPMDVEAIDHGDGQVIENVVQAYRKDVAKREDVKQDIVINVGDE